MVRQFEFQTVIAGCTTKEFYQIACSDSKAITRYHLEVNKDDSVTVSEWDVDKLTRTVCFTLDMAIPAALKRFVGAEPIRIKEKQTCQWIDDHTLKITSLPMLQISVGKSLTTQAVLYITTTSEGCQVDVTVTVSASVPWPLQSTVETLMADEAKKTVGQYVEYITKYVDDTLTEMNNLAMLQQEEQQQLLEAAADIAIIPQQQQGLVAASAQELPSTPPQHQQQLVAAVQPKQPVQLAAAPIQVHATAATQQPLSRLQVAVPATEEQEMFYDAQELASADWVTQALLKELQHAQQARLETNRLLISIKDSVQQMERAMLKEAAFQEGVRYGQRMGTSSLLLSVTAAAAAASAVTAYVLMRRSR